VQLCTTAHGSAAAPDIVGDGAGGAIVAWRDNRSDNGDIYAQRVNSSGATQWLAGGVAVCTATTDQTFPVVASDGAGGAIVNWQDGRNGNTDIYAQRINATGAPQWTINGVAVCTAAGVQQYRKVVTDGAGGIFIVWADLRSGTGDIYAQRVTASGNCQWTADGVGVCTAANDQTRPHLVTDGAGGFIVTWQDKRNGTDYDNYAQRVNGSGAAQWAANGVVLCSSTGDQTDQVITSDGATGAIVTWVSSSGLRRLYAQRVSSTGVPQWTANGVAVCPARIYEQYDPVIVSDLTGGAFVAWTDLGMSDPDVYGQRLSAAGALAWGTAGVGLILDPGVQRSPASIPDGSGGIILTWMERQPGQPSDVYARRIAANGTTAWSKVAVCKASGTQGLPAITTDGAGGAIIVWTDLRSGLDMGIYAQRLNASGVPQWTTDGVALSTGTGYRMTAGIVSDGAGGAIVGWQDNRGGTGWDVYAQRVNAAGSPQWTANGVAVCTAGGDQQLAGDPGAVAIVSDGAGGAYLAWTDLRNGNKDVFAQRISSTGVSLWTANGEAICTAAGSQQSHSIGFDAFSPGLFVVWEDYRSGTSGDVYLQRVTPTGSVSWSTGGVSIENSVPNAYNPRVIADGLGGAIVTWFDYRTNYGNIYAQRVSSVGNPLWTLNGVTVCGASGDQWKPEIIADANNGAIVTWEDKRGGAGNEAEDIYAQRLNSQGALLWQADGVVVCSAAEMQTAPAIVRDDAGGAIVSWQDRRDGKSDYMYSQRLNGAGLPQWSSNGVPTSVAPGMAPGVLLSLGFARPNPSRGPVMIAFTLPSDKPATIELLDVRGRRVGLRTLEGLGAGRHVLTWESRASVAAGVYLVVLRQGAQSRALKACVLK
jgi:hypothetical protein